MIYKFVPSCRKQVTVTRVPMSQCAFRLNYYIYTHTHTHIHTEREREREREICPTARVLLDAYGGVKCQRFV